MGEIRSSKEFEVRFRSQYFRFLQGLNCGTMKCGGMICVGINCGRDERCGIKSGVLNVGG